MADKDLSPEKRLLKVIEGQSDKDSGPSPLGAGKKYFSIANLKARLSFFKDKFKKGPAKSSSQPFELKGINVFLQSCILIVAVGLGISVKVEFDNLDKKQLAAMPKLAADAQAEPLGVVSLLQSESFYLDRVRDRDLFKFGDVKRAASVNFGKEGEEKKISELEELTKGFKLVGISWSNEPDAIIEDEVAKRTYFISTGAMINEIKVQAIFKDKVILRYQGDEVELR